MNDDQPTLRTGYDRHAWERPGAFEVAAGVHRIPLPLPGDGLRAVNVYAITQPDGVVLVDSGWGTAQAEQDLVAGLALLDHDLGDITQVLCTHVHRDHAELGLILQQRLGTRVALGTGEKASLDRLVDREPDALSPLVFRMQQLGAPALAETIRRARDERTDGEAPIRWGMPTAWLDHEQRIELADRTLTVLATPGHTQGHVVFVDEAARVLLSGDHVLPHITPSIGFEAALVDTALADYLASLALVRALPDLQMLPAHGPPQPTTHDRIDALVAHHDDRLAASLAAVGGAPVTPFDVARQLGWTRRATPFDELDPFNQMLAVNETAAHLEVLVARGHLARRDSDGVATFMR